MEEERKIPKSTVKPLLEYCEKASKEAKVSAAELFGYYLELMKKYDDYFFAKPWSEKPEKPLRLDDPFDFAEEDRLFIDAGKSYVDECERFTIVCLRRNISLAGFDSEGFVSDFDFYGKVACYGCVVPHVTWLRSQVARVEEYGRKLEEEMKQKPSSFTMELYEYNKSPEAVKRNKMLRIELRFLEELGSGEGKSCEVHNKYKCPYKEESKQLIENGRLAQFVWKLVEWYDFHWNRNPSITPSQSEMKWYHYDEPSVIDVTSYEDVLKAIEDGRLKKILREHGRYEREREK